MGFLRRLRRLLGGGQMPGQRPVNGIHSATGDESVEAMFRNAVARHADGDLDGAERIYRLILERERDFIPALHLLGNVFAQQGSLQDAGAHLERALALSPDDADILSDLANLKRLEGRPGEANTLLDKAIALEPGRAAFHYALSRLHLKSGNLEAAISALERTVALDDRHAEALNDLGAAFLEIGRYEQARRSLEAAAENHPSSPVALRNLANLHLRLGEPQQSVQCFRRALERAPEDSELRTRLAEALLQCGEVVAALNEYLSVAGSKPGDASSWKRLADAAAILDRRTDAISWYRRALDIEPRQPDVLNNLGILLSNNGNYEEAAELFEKAVRIQPNFDRGFDNLGGTYHLQGRYEEAVSAYRKSLDIDPDNTVTLSNLIAIANYRRPGEAGLMDELHARYLRSVAPERGRATRKHKDAPAPDRRLRVGYVSPDFRQHSVAFFIEPVIEGHNRKRFEVYCYSDVSKPDAVTGRFKALADHWRDVSLDSNEDLATRIRKDKIDLLVDLDGHYAKNRLPVFAQKPAPVQIAYLGFPATTGLPEMDYRLTDAVADPRGVAGARYSETLIRLPETFLCYRPPQSAPPVAGTRTDPGGIVFGSFNELPKVSPEVLRSWCRILEQVPGSRLLLKATALVDPATRMRLNRSLEAAGISSDRVELLARTATLEEHLALYARIDVALDTFPYNGTTTTCEALFMGVPVVTLAGDAHAGRVGVSLLSVLDLPQLVAASEEDYVARAVKLAKDQKERSKFRATLRDRMLGSPLCDPKRFLQALEGSYQQCWDLWLKSEQRKSENETLPLNVAGALKIEIRDGLRMALPDDLDRLTAYVLLEQEDWFEDEIEFLRRFLSPGMRVLDVGANFGVYTLLAAKHVGVKGKVFSVEPASTTARWLRANVALNAFERVDVLQLALSDKSGELKLSLQSGAECNRIVEDTSNAERNEVVKVMRLDDCAHEYGIQSPDFVKLDAEGAEKQIIDGGRRFFAEGTPLVMFEIKSAEDFDLTLVRKFSGLGYRPLRLIPGLGVLCPLEISEPLDPYALNLFACKDDQRKTLADRGLLAENGFDGPGAGPASVDEVWEYFFSRNFSASRVDEWKTSMASNRTDSGRRWMRMLGHYVAAAKENSPPGRRLSSLKTALQIVAETESCIHPAARLNSLARIAWGLGRRSLAVNALRSLMDLDPAQAPVFDWPFLPASPHFDLIDPGDRAAAWSEACVRDQFERLRSFSSYFLRDSDSVSLERLRQSAFQRPEMERRRLLVRLRRGLPLVDASPAVREDSPENRNPEFWLSRLMRG